MVEVYLHSTLHLKRPVHNEVPTATGRVCYSKFLKFNVCTRQTTIKRPILPAKSLINRISNQSFPSNSINQPTDQSHSASNRNVYQKHTNNVFGE
jgi:hypothetical protein